MADELSDRCAGLLSGSYDCVDRIVLNAYFRLGYGAGGFRVWWRRLHDESDAELDNTHLMRMAGRFSRRVRAWAKDNGVPVVDCRQGERKHLLASEYLAGHPDLGTGVFLILVAKAPAPVWDVRITANGKIGNLARRYSYVNHYSFHILDPDWGHLTIKMSGHPPFGAQIMLNGHEYVACQARRGGVAFVKDGNCFTQLADPQRLAQIADTLSHDAAAGRLGQVCDRWIYSACLCFALDTGERARSGFHYNYSVYQAEYSRNLIFRSGAGLDGVFEPMVDRIRSRLDIPAVKTLFGKRSRPRGRGGHIPRQQIAIETPSWDLTVFKVHFGNLTLKAYSKGERVLRLEAIVHNTRDLRCGRILERFAEVTARLHAMVDRFATICDCVDVSFCDDGLLDQLAAPSQLGRVRTGGVDVNRPRIRAVLHAVAALATQPGGFTVADLAAKVTAMTSPASYTTRQAAYDLRKLRGKALVDKPGRTRRYHVPAAAARTITALLTIRDHVIAPILAGTRSPRTATTSAHLTDIDRDYDILRAGMQTLFGHLGIATPTAAAA